MPKLEMGSRERAQVALLKFREDFGNPSLALRDGAAREQLAERKGACLDPCPKHPASTGTWELNIHLSVR